MPELTKQQLAFVSRNKDRMSQRELAAKVNRSVSYIHYLLKGRKEPLPEKKGMFNENEFFNLYRSYYTY